jgi:plasmid stabilization system protein ParE
MSFDYKFSDNATNDMDVIEEYLSRFYPGTADRFFNKLKEKLSLLETMPYMYPEYEKDKYFRRMNVNDFIVFYNVEEKANLVVIHNIIHSSRNIEKIVSDLEKL